MNCPQRQHRAVPVSTAGRSRSFTRRCDRPYFGFGSRITMRRF
jgi:hypothetical protein